MEFIKCKYYLKNLVHPLQNLVHPSQNLVHPILELSRPLFNYPWSVYSFRDLCEVIRGQSLATSKQTLES